MECGLKLTCMEAFGSLSCFHVSGSARRFDLTREGGVGKKDTLRRSHLLKKTITDDRKNQREFEIPVGKGG